MTEANAMTSKHPETLALHAGWRRDSATNAVAVPIYQTTSYQFDSAEHAANLFALKELGNVYTRIMNPTNDVLEQRLAAIEGGVAALAVGSGQAASAFAVQNLARVGDNIVTSTDLYGGTWNLFANSLKDQGIEARFVDPSDPEGFARATDDRTRAYYAEPEVDTVSDCGGRGDWSVVRGAADHGQHGCAIAGASIRSWGGRSDVFHHQVHRRTWHLDWWHCHRR